MPIQDVSDDKQMVTVRYENDTLMLYSILHVKRHEGSRKETKEEVDNFHMHSNHGAGYITGKKALISSRLTLL